MIGAPSTSKLTPLVSRLLRILRVVGFAIGGLMSFAGFHGVDLEQL